jgi:hypothetical protein
MGQPLGDGSLTEEKLRQLLALHAEHDDLDFKEYLDLRRTEDKIELAKDFGAMQSIPTGGYILVGVDDNGQPSVARGAIVPGQFDPAKLHDLAENFLPSIRVNATTHSIGGVAVAMIFVGPPNPPAVAIFTKDGQYEAAKGKSTTVFRAGDVFVRRGTKSVRWQYTDLPALLKPWEAAIRADEQARAVAYAQEVAQGQRGKNLAVGPVGSLTWRLNTADFESSLLEAMRGQDLIVLKKVLLDIVADAERLFVERADDDLNQALDRLTSVISLALTYDDRDLFRRSRDAFQAIYGLAIGQYGNATPTVDGHSPRLLWGVATRIEAVGGLAVRLRAWWAVRPLALQDVPQLATIYRESWLRHAITTMARANLLYVETDSGDGSAEPIGGPLVAVARQQAERIASLRPDAHALAPFTLNSAPAAHDPVLDSLCQFDALWCVVAVADTRHSGNEYPSFAAFYSERTAPAFELLATNPEARAMIAGDDEPKVPAAIRAVLSTADSVSWSDSHRPWRLHSDVVDNYLNEAP